MSYSILKAMWFDLGEYTICGLKKVKMSQETGTWQFMLIFYYILINPKGVAPLKNHNDESIWIVLVKGQVMVLVPQPS